VFKENSGPGKAYTIYGWMCRLNPVVRLQYWRLRKNNFQWMWEI